MTDGNSCYPSGESRIVFPLAFHSTRKTYQVLMGVGNKDHQVQGPTGGDRGLGRLMSVSHG